MTGIQGKPIWVRVIGSRLYTFLNKEPQDKGIAPPTFVTQSIPLQRHIRDGGHSEQVGSERCGLGISRNKAKCVLKK